MAFSKIELPHPLILLLAGVAAAAALTWILPSGAFDRRDDPTTGRRIVVAATYHPVPRAPVGLLAAATAVPRGFVAAGEVIAVVLFVGGALRLAMCVAALVMWIAWTIRYAARNRVSPAGTTRVDARTLPAKHVLILAIALAPMAAYVYGALRLDWGFNELSGAFLLAALIAGLVGGLGLTKTVSAYLEGAASMVSAAIMIGVARSISLVLEDGRVVDTILYGLATPLAHMPPVTAALLQIPVHGLVHLVVPSVSGQAVLTMPLFAPLADLLGLSRQVPVLAYQTGGGLAELIWPTNGPLMAVLLAAGVPYQKWIRFVIGGVLLATLLGIAGIA